jgi:hypothetical protein
MNEQNENIIRHVTEKEAKQKSRRALGAGAVIGIAAGSLFTGITENALSHESTPDNSDVKVVNEVVGKGDTLWHIVQEAAPSQDIRKTIDSIEAADHTISPSSIQPGEIVHVPIDTSLNK